MQLFDILPDTFITTDNETPYDGTLDKFTQLSCKYCLPLQVVVCFVFGCIILCCRYPHAFMRQVLCFDTTELNKPICSSTTLLTCIVDECYSAVRVSHLSWFTDCRNFLSACNTIRCTNKAIYRNVFLTRVVLFQWQICPCKWLKIDLFLLMTDDKLERAVYFHNTLEEKAFVMKVFIKYTVGQRRCMHWQLWNSHLKSRPETYFLFCNGLQMFCPDTIYHRI